jgi:hypothetical protein
MVDNNDSFYREIDEEVRRERMARFWDKYGLYVVGLFAIFLASIGGYQLWQSRQATLANEGGTIYNDAARLLADGKTDEALKSYETLAEGGHPGYATLAALQAAGADMKAGKSDAAVAQFDKVAKDSTTDPLLKSFAVLQAASLRLGKADLQEMQNRLNDLAADSNPWRFNARELLGIAAYKAGDIVAATKEFDRILSDQGAPRGVAARVRVLMGTIMAQTLAKVPTASTATPAPAGPDVNAGDTPKDGAAAPAEAKPTDTAPKAEAAPEAGAGEKK